jgi:prophage regulatory protein
MKTDTEEQNNARFLRMMRCSEVVKLTSLSRATIYRMAEAGQFPPRRQISLKRVGWIEQEVLDWMRNREAIEAPLLAYSR